MSPITYSCNLCGFMIRPARPRHPPFSWLDEFRAVISPLDGKVRLTGVGLFVDVNTGTLFAPSDANTRWNDDGYNQEQSQEFGVGTQFENGLYGFVFHDSCWSVLERAFHPGLVPLDRLYELCLSMPKPLATSCINWGHDYGGLYYWQKKPYFPWDVVEEPGVYGMDDLEDSESSDSEAGRQWVERYGFPLPREEDSDYDFGDDEWIGPTLRTSIVTSDPYHINELRMILQEQPRPPPVRTVTGSLPHGKIDPFSQLPQEIRITIATYLPTADILNGRLALRGFWDIFDSQQFWMTRFLGSGAERSWLFESRQPSDDPRDWRFLYRQTSDAHLSQTGGLRNRRRIWELALGLKSVLSLEPLAQLSTFEDATEGNNIEWIAAKADICNPAPEQPHKGFVRGCRVLHRQRIRLRPQKGTRNIALSFVQVGEHSYLSGLRLDSGNGEIVQVGYRALTEQIFELGSMTLTGIRLAIGPRGIQGLQFFTDASSHCSRWFGRRDDLPETDCLVSRKPISALDVQLDACKIVGLAVTCDPAVPRTVIPEKAIDYGPDTLRQAGLWFPSFPPSSVNLNQHCFPQRSNYTAEFRPLIWTHFGGPNGSYLRNLVAIRLHFSQELYGIEFKYNEYRIPDCCCSLGRHKCPGRSCYGDYNFAIDGPGGELVAHIDIALLTLDGNKANVVHQTSVRGVEIATNLGRSFRLSTNEDLHAMTVHSTGKVIMRRLEASEGTTITGLYAHQFHGIKSNFMTLGVISEAL